MGQYKYLLIKKKKISKIGKITFKRNNIMSKALFITLLGHGYVDPTFNIRN